MDKHCDKHDHFVDDCPWCQAAANEGIDWDKQDELLLTPNELGDALINEAGLGYPSDYWDCVGEDDWMVVAQAQLAKVKQHYEQELKDLTGKLYIAEEEIRILQQKRLDRPESREEAEEIAIKVWNMACAVVDKPSNEYQIVRTNTLRWARERIIDYFGKNIAYWEDKLAQYDNPNECTEWQALKGEK